MFFNVRRWCLLWILGWTLGMAPGLLQAQSPDISEAEVQEQYGDLSSFLEKAIQAEKLDLDQLVKNLEELKGWQAGWAKELNAARLQISAVSNLVSLSSPALEDLDKALASLKQTVEDASARVKDFQDKQTDIAAKLGALADQRAANQNRMESLKTRRDDLPLIRTLTNQLKEANELFKLKEKRLGEFQDIYRKLIEEWSAVRDEGTGLLERLSKRIAERKREDLFRRSRNPLVAVTPAEFRRDLDHVAGLITQGLQSAYWAEQARALWKAGGVLLVTSLVVFGIVAWLCFRLRALGETFLSRQERTGRVWFFLTLHLLNRSFPLLGAAVFVYGYTLARDLYETSAFLRGLCQVLFLWLLTSWVIHFLQAVKETFRPERFVFVVRRVRVLVSTGRWLLLGYVVLQESLGRSSVLLLLYRLGLEVALLAWSFIFWRELKRQISVNPPRWMLGRPWIFNVFMGAGYGIALGGVMLELAGYAQLAIYWYVGWARSLVLGLWGFLFYRSLTDWDVSIGTASAFAPEADEETRSSVRWLTVKTLWAVWLLAAIVGMLLAWGAKQTLIVAFFQLLDTPLPFGGLKFRLLGLIYAGLILAVTHVGTTWLKHFIKSRVFRHSGLEMGLQESIVAIAGYVLWFMGILGALNALGFSGTSLTVAFGALGVGLGFGLQNIFNNFISGLILLFERPIQVGDSIEIDGTWGEVRKINVRSTIVQTVDNASLIIPNSEFISGRVTNWSFKDLRIRRNINVGVAYGSNVELVRETLLEVAGNHPLVYKHPEPTVLFVDFGDSALIFRLRVWTTVPVCLQVETDLRFAIHRLFQERGIEIAFPQMDVHIRTMPEPSARMDPVVRVNPVREAPSAMGDPGPPERAPKVE